MSKLFFPLLLASAGALAEPATLPAAHYGDSNCHIGALLPVPSNGRVSWTGACKDGYAEGPGVLAWNDADDNKRRIEGTLAHGGIAGEATLIWDKDDRRNRYIGLLRDGQPEGQGFFQYANGDMYEGGVARGKPEGAGIQVDADRSRYEGQWRDGRRHGQGRATFTRGGSYDGEWKDDKFDGTGTIVYAGTPRTWQGRFVDGRPDTVAAPVVAAAGNYKVQADDLRTGSKVRKVVANVYIPPAASWAQLSVEQQNAFKLFYAALAPGDEPPYPVEGLGTSIKLVGKIQNNFLFHGSAWVYVLVGADGKARSASVIGKVPEDLGRYLNAALLSQAYKPAMCQGSPCEMIYPLGLNLR